MKRLGLIFLLLAAATAATAQTGPKVLVLGFDGMDPNLLARFRAEGRMPNFDAFLAAVPDVEPAERVGLDALGAVDLGQTLHFQHAVSPLVSPAAEPPGRRRSGRCRR